MCLHRSYHQTYCSIWLSASMNSNKKRKMAGKTKNEERFSDSEEEEIIVLKKKTKKARKLVLTSDEEEETTAFDSGNMQSEEATSINRIKKDAKTRAKKLATQGDQTPGSSPKPQKNKTPPAKPANSIMNYFRPQNVKKEVIEPEIQKNVSSPVPLEKDGFKVSVLKETNLSQKKRESVKPNNEDLEVKPKIAKKKQDPELTDVKEEEKPVSPKEKVVSPKKALASPKKKVVSPKKALASPKKKLLSPKKEFVPQEHPKPEPQRISDLLVDKYKPKTCKQIIGQQGAASPMTKLVDWLKNWYRTFDAKGAFRAALISGPPGIGKTTTAQLVCKELGFDYLELNASDTRNKKSLQENLNQLLGNTKLTNFFKPTAVSSDCCDESQKLTSKHCVIMDEVDGMSGNEDRGGTQELILLIKKTKVPIICICNDRQSQQMRTLANHCLDLRFPKPRLEQIKTSLMSIAYKEKISVSAHILEKLIESSHQDIRQCIHNLALLAASSAPLKGLINAEQRPIKDIKLGPFEAIKKVFSVGEEYARMSFMDKSDLFFCDYSLMPLFVYENFLNVNLSGRDITTQLKQVLKTINSISYGDLIDREIHANQNWSLLPVQAAFCSVMPGAYMRGNSGLGFPQFPQYLGRLSTWNKNKRLVNELMSHSAITITGSRSAFALDYMEPLRNTLMRPLIAQGKDGIRQVLHTMEHYSLLREDMTAIFDLAKWSDQDDPFKKVDSKTKTALTKECKRGFALPYSTD